MIRQKGLSLSVENRHLWHKVCTISGNKMLGIFSKQEYEKYPIGSSALKNDFYVDDCITRADAIPEALQIQKELNHILLSSGFKLRKWCANSNHLLQGLDKEDIIPTAQFEDAAVEDCSIKTLGITWNPTIDKLCGKAQAVTKTNFKTSST